MSDFIQSKPVFIYFVWKPKINIFTLCPITKWKYYNNHDTSPVMTQIHLFLINTSAEKMVHHFATANCNFVIKFEFFRKSWVFGLFQIKLWWYAFCMLGIAAMRVDLRRLMGYFLDSKFRILRMPFSNIFIFYKVESYCIRTCEMIEFSLLR